jgi:hypothetical protein
MSSRRTPAAPAATVTVRSAQRLRALRRTVPPAHNPRGTIRRENKPLDHGATVEVRLDKLLNSPRSGKVVCWRRPGIYLERLSGDRYFPDAASIVPEIESIVPVRPAQVAGRPDYNVIIEYKGQRTSGSAKKKIGVAIDDIALLCDQHKIVGAVILDAPALSDQEILALKAQGQCQAVVVLTAGEVRAGQLVPELERVARLRRRLARRVTPKGAYRPTKRPDRYERALAARIAMAAEVKRQMRKVSQGAGLVR